MSNCYCATIVLLYCCTYLILCVTILLCYYIVKLLFAFTSFRDSGKIIEDKLSEEEHLTLNDLIKTRDFIIQKADKGNTVVILNKNDYISKMKEILSDSSKF